MEGRVAILISGKVDFKTQTLLETKREEQIHQIHMMILSIYAPNKNAPKYMI
jgi:hypothetical protein